jgi:hypothetical protein
MTTQKLEVRLTEKEAAHHFSNAAALYVLGVGFCLFACKARSPLLVGICFWFSVFLLCDCLRLARGCQRLAKNNNLLLTLDASGLTHFVSWLWPERISWKEITGFRSVKSPQSETIFFQTKGNLGQFLRFALFGAPKFDLPVSCLNGGKEEFLALLDKFPEARRLTPERANPADLEKAA